jgi:hypothetical protein
MSQIRTPGSAEKTGIAAARLAIGLSAVTVALLAALHAASPEFDPSWRMISEYALGRSPWLLSLCFLSWGIGTWALAVAIRPHVSTRAGIAGIVFLLLAGAGEAMASVFDVRQEAGHGIAGLLGTLGLPIAAVLISIALPGDGAWARARRPLIRLAALTWVGPAALVLTLGLLMSQLAAAYGGQLPQTAPDVLPAGVVPLVGWADRLIVVLNCAWAGAVAWRASRVARATRGEGQTDRSAHARLAPTS